MDNMLGAAADRLYSALCDAALSRQAEQGQPPAQAWQASEDAGFADALMPESQGGAGLTLAETLPLALAAGRHLYPFPLIDTLLARAWLRLAGHAAPPGPIALAPHGLAEQAHRIVGAQVPWARTARHVLAVAQGRHWLLPMQAACVEADGVHGSLAASVSWSLEDAQRIDAPAVPDLDTLAAAAYAGLLAGAMERALRATVEYAGQRSQFGKPIGRFQAVQQQLSVMAEQAASAHMAAQLAFQGDGAMPRPWLAALGKARASQAAPQVADIAHAVHGAIGITEECDLQRCTRRLREWRLAAGSESYWHARIGARALAARDDALGFLRGVLQGAQTP